MVLPATAVLPVPIHGLCEPGFEAVAAAFEKNFKLHGEVGASVCVQLGGRTVVDLWGGFRDPQRTQPWQADTVSIVFSCTKAATALCAHILVDRGLLDLNAPVAQYWPEFAQAGKQDATVVMALNHTLGLPALRAPVPLGAFADWSYMVQRLAAEAPFWPPGTRVGYHMATYGWLVGELVRRVSGQSLGRFFHQEVALPLGLDFWIGLPPAVGKRVAPLLPYVRRVDTPRTRFMEQVQTDPTSVPHLALLNNGRYKADSPAMRAAEVGGTGGVSNARALAGLYAPLANGGALYGVRLLSAQRIEAMRQCSAQTPFDATLCLPTRFGQGFMLRMGNGAAAQGQSLRIGESAFGHAGMGGSIGFADPAIGMSLGYTMNQLGAGMLLNECGQTLVEAAYASVPVPAGGPH